MAERRRLQVSLIVDQTEEGTLHVALLGVDDAGQYNWIADTEFGPLDTRSDLISWLVRKAGLDRLRLMR